MATAKEIKVGSIVHRRAGPILRGIGIVLTIPAADWMGDDHSASVYWFTAKESGWHKLTSLVAVLT